MPYKKNYKTCVICGQSFPNPISGNKVTCSKDCSSIKKKSIDWKRHYKNCIICGKSFPSPNSVSKLTCSSECLKLHTENKRHYRTCVVCDSKFPSYKTDLKLTCSKACLEEYHKRNRHRTCEICSESFYTSPSNIKHTCSEKCAKERVERTRVFDTCVICGERYQTNPSLRKLGKATCGQECYDKLRYSRRKFSICTICGQSFPSKTGITTCGKECAEERRKRNVKYAECIVCGQRFSGNLKHRITCSKECSTIRKKKTQTIDMIGVRPEGSRLVAIELVDHVSEGAHFLCQCDCGKTTVVHGSNLRNGNTRSCGCLQREASRANMVQANDERQFFAGTNVAKIQSNKPSANNTTGVRGVSWSNQKNKYTARIGFKSKDYYLGAYKTLEEAAQVRKLAEQSIYGSFLEWYYETYPQYKK